jgi:predicted enzyme related to lactoylglutathione lyase
MRPAAINRVVHLELHTGELADARAFYAELLGWEVQPVRTRTGTYLGLDLGTELGGGMVECPTARSLWLPYVDVVDIHQATDGARMLGATVLLEPREGPRGWRSVIATRYGGELAFWQSKG